MSTMHFEIKALRSTEGTVTLGLEANSEADAAIQARERGYTVLSVKAKSSAWLKPRATRFSLSLFTQELVALLNAGINLMEALEALAEKDTHGHTGRILRHLIQSLKEGNQFSHALQTMPEHFPTLYVATVRASEKTGALAEALTRYVQHQTRSDALRDKLVSASLYPAILLSVGVLVMLFLMLYVVPKFSHIYENNGSDLPLLSKALVEWGNIVEAHGMLMLAAFCATLAGSAYWLLRPSTKRLIGEKIWQMPSLGKRMRIYQLARFYRTLGMLLRGGIPIVSALDMTAGMLPALMRGQLDAAIRKIREGRPPSEVLETHGLTTPIAVRMLRVAEHSGTMDEMMEQVASFYEDDMGRWMDRFSKLLEPVLMTVIGLVIGTIVALMYMPIFELAGSIQ